MVYAAEEAAREVLRVEAVAKAAADLKKKRADLAAAKVQREKELETARKVNDYCWSCSIR